MFLFKKKDKKKAMKIPVDIVKNLSSKGMSEPEIVAVLRKQGYSPYEIEKAISLALKSTVSGSPPSSQVTQTFTSPQPQSAAHEFPPTPTEIKEQPSFTSSQSPLEFHTLPLQPQLQQPLQQFEQKPPVQEQKQFPPIPFPFPEKKEERKEQTVSEPQEFEHTYPDITLEEIIEGIVVEKWQTFEEHLERLRKRDDELQKQIIDLRKEISELKEAMRKTEESFIAKLEEQGEQVSSIGARIGSIEKVFKEFLPELTESMRLITEALEKTKKQKAV